MNTLQSKSRIRSKMVLSKEHVLYITRDLSTNILSFLVFLKKKRFLMKYQLILI